MKTLILLVAMAGTCWAWTAKDDAEFRGLQNDQKLREIKEKLDESTGNAEALNKSVQAAGWETYVANRDRWEDAHPYEEPRKPVLGGTAASYPLDKAKIADHAARLDRWNARMKARKTESSAPADSDFKKMADRSAGDADRCFPAAKDENSPLSKKVLELYAMLKATKSPILHDADLTFIAYSMAAAMLGIEPVEPR